MGGLTEPKKAAELAPAQYHTLNDRWSSFENIPTPVGLRPAVLALDTRVYVLGGRGAQGPLY